MLPHEESFRPVGKNAQLLARALLFLYRMILA